MSGQVNPAARGERAVPLHIAQPFAPQAEHALLGAMVAAPIETYMQIGDRLRSDHFYDPFCRAAFAMAMDLMAARELPDMYTLAAKLEGVLPLDAQQIIDKLEAMYYINPGPVNLEAWSSIVIDKAIERGLARTGERLVAIAHAQGKSADDKLGEATRLLAEVGSRVSTDTIVTAELMLHETVELIQQNQAKSTGVTGLATGFDELDEMTSGLQPSDLIIVAARPSMGKTSFVLGVAKAVAANPVVDLRKPVLMFSLEMGVTSIGMRWISTGANIDFNRLRTGRLSAAENARMLEAMEQGRDWPFFLERSASITVQQVAAKARRVHREHGLAMIAIDYLQLIQEGDDGRHGRNRSEALSDISRSLKALAKELNCPVVALSQLNRSLEQRVDKRPIMSDLRESGALEQDADLILFLYRDQVYNANTPEPGVAEVIIGKQRNGPIGTVKLGFHGPTTTFSNKPPVRSDPFATGYRDPSGTRDRDE